MITNQEVLDLNVQWFFREGNGQAIVGDGCVYWSEDGKRCAIGCVVPENIARKWQQKCNGASIDRLSAYGARSAVEEIFEDSQRKFLRDLQEAHDGNFTENRNFHKDFGRALKKLALSNGLNLPPDFDELVALRSAQGGGK